MRGNMVDRSYDLNLPLAAALSAKRGLFRHALSSLLLLFPSGRVLVFVRVRWHLMGEQRIADGCLESREELDTFEPARTQADISDRSPGSV
jgi:hypothetical protein